MPGIRVTAGTAKGRKLKMPPGETTRPIMDRVKQALFNIIGPGIVDATFLDLFGGTGSVGIEALSRGAAEAVFVEINRRALQIIRDNLEATRLAAKAKLIRGDALEFLSGEPEAGFDYIYIAPPQYAGLWAKALALIDARPEWLNPDGWAIAQIDPLEYSDTTLPDGTGQPLENLELIDQRKYGNTLLCFYERPGE